MGVSNDSIFIFRANNRYYSFDWPDNPMADFSTKLELPGCISVYLFFHIGKYFWERGGCGWRRTDLFGQLREAYVQQWSSVD